MISREAAFQDSLAQRARYKWPPIGSPCYFHGTRSSESYFSLRLKLVNQYEAGFADNPESVRRPGFAVSVV